MKVQSPIQRYLAKRDAELARAHSASTVRLPLNEFCGAKTRKGTPCKRRDIYASGRCALHGGLSTGPRTSEGKAKAAQNLPHKRKALEH